MFPNWVSLYQSPTTGSFYSLVSFLSESVGTVAMLLQTFNSLLSHLEISKGSAYLILFNFIPCIAFHDFFYVSHTEPLGFPKYFILLTLFLSVFSPSLCPILCLPLFFRTLSRARFGKHLFKIPRKIQTSTKNQKIT